MNGGRALAWLAGGAVMVIVWLSRPFATALLLGALMGFTGEPVYARLAAWSRRPFVASVAVVLTAGLVIVGSLVGFASLFFSEAGVVAIAVREELKPGGLVTTWLDTIMGWLGRFGFSTQAVADRLSAAAGDIASGSAAVAAGWRRAPRASSSASSSRSSPCT